MTWRTIIYVVALCAVILMIRIYDQAAENAQPPNIADPVEVPLMEEEEEIIMHSDEPKESAGVTLVGRMNDAVDQLRPDIDPLIKKRLIAAMLESGEVHEIHPFILLAIAYRESRLDPEVGNCDRRGNLGECGYMQIYPNGAAERECGPDNCEQSELECNISTAACWLDRCRGWCGNRSPWLWIGGYGRRRCPMSVAEARTFRELRHARRILCNIAEECLEIWP